MFFSCYVLSKSFVLWIDEMKSLFTVQEIRSMLEEKDRDDFQSNIFDFALNNPERIRIKDVLKGFLVVFSREEIQKQISIYFKENKCESIRGLMSLVDASKDFLLSEQQLQFWETNFPCCGKKINIFLAACSDEKDIEQFPELLKRAEKSLSAEKIKSMLMERDGCGNNIIALSSRSGQKNADKKVKEIMTNRVGSEVVEYLLNEKIYGKTCVDKKRLSE
jgi:hypothetical protein